MRQIVLAAGAGLTHAALLAAPPMLCIGVAAFAARPANWLLLALLAVAAAMEVWAVDSRVETGSPPPLCRLSALALFVGFWLALSERALRGTSVLSPHAMLGSILLLCGIVLRVWAIRSLGDRFVSDHRAAPLVTAGIYAVLRHPSETGQLLLAIGAALLVDSGWAMFWVAAAILPLTWLRLRQEERILTQESSAYGIYRARVDGLLPLRRLISYFPRAAPSRKESV
jgi:protein-S-isoprenylcysteine O-methyltransferase Ste14